MSDPVSRRVIFKKPKVWPKWLNKHWAEALEKYDGKTITIGKSHPWNWTNPWDVPNVEGREIKYTNDQYSRMGREPIPANLLFAPILDEEVCDAVIGQTHWSVCLVWCQPEIDLRVPIHDEIVVENSADLQKVLHQQYLNTAEHSTDLQEAMNRYLKRDIKFPNFRFHPDNVNDVNGEPNMAFYSNPDNTAVRILQEQLLILRNEKNLLQERIEKLQVDLANSEHSAKSNLNNATTLSAALKEAEGQLLLANGHIDLLEEAAKSHASNLAPPRSLVDRCYSRVAMEVLVSCRILSDIMAETSRTMIMPITFLGRALKRGSKKTLLTIQTVGGRTISRIQKFRHWFDSDCPVQHPSFANAFVLALVLSYVSPIASLGYVGIYELMNLQTEKANAAMIIPPAATPESDRLKAMRIAQQQYLEMMDAFYQAQVWTAQIQNESNVINQQLEDAKKNSPKRVVEAYEQRNNPQRPVKRFY